MFKILYLNTNIFEEKALFDKAMSMIAEERKEKISMFKNPVPARLSLGAGVLLHIALNENGLLKELENIRYHQYGKPYLNRDDFYFNLSHSGEYAVCVYGNRPVGIDLQKIKTEIPKNTDKILCEEEKQYLDKLDFNDKRNEFYRIWSRKESLLKWDGRGLRIPLTSISVIQDQILFEEKKLYFTDIDLLLPEYALTVCCESKEQQIELTDAASIFLTKY